MIAMVNIYMNCDESGHMIEHKSLLRAVAGTFIVVVCNTALYFLTYSTEALIALYGTSATFLLSLFYYLLDWFKTRTDWQKNNSEQNFVARLLSDEATMILLACTRTTKRYLYVESNMHFTKLDAGEVELFKGDRKQGEELWAQAISSLEQHRFIRRVDNLKFEITNEGVLLADSLRFESFENSEALKRLSYPARDLLMCAAKHPTHEIIRAETLTETEIKVGDREFCNTGYMSDYRNANQAFNQLLDLELIEDTGEGFSFEVTVAGEQVANVLESIKSR